MSFPGKVVLLALQAIVVLFVALHNWLPLGKLNNLRGVRRQFSTRTLSLTTLLNLTPFAIGFAATAFYRNRGTPDWLVWWLWITYGLAVYGSLKAWWIPYLVRPDAKLAERYRIMYEGTYTVLPERNGIRLNMLHLLFDGVTLAILLDLALG